MTHLIGTFSCATYDCTNRTTGWHCDLCLARRSQPTGGSSMYDITGHSMTVRAWRDGDPVASLPNTPAPEYVVEGQDMADCVLVVLGADGTLVWYDEALSTHVRALYVAAGRAAFAALAADNEDADAYARRSAILSTAVEVEDLGTPDHDTRWDEGRDNPSGPMHNDGLGREGGSA